jgi:hypothetical protein
VTERTRALAVTAVLFGTTRGRVSAVVRLLIVVSAGLVLAASAAAFDGTTAQVVRLSPPVSALTKLPAARSLSPLLRNQISILARQVGSEPRRAFAVTRLLRADVTNLRVYGFAATNGRLCLVVARKAGECRRLESVRGSIWIPIASPPSYRGAVVGIVADAVKVVRVSINQHVVQAGVRHNTFIVRFRNNPNTEVSVKVSVKV